MSHFAEAFWSIDYAGGLGILFAKLQQGVQENQQILTIARMRADAEESYGQHIGEIGPATDRITDGFQRDDGASVRKAYEGVRVEMEEASRKHHKVASNIRELVVFPFGRWCEQHAARVQNSHDDLQARVKAHDKQAEWVKKLRSSYFNKCRLVEDLEEEDKLAFKEPGSDMGSSPKLTTPKVNIQEPGDDEAEPVELGDAVYPPEQIKKILSHMLDMIKIGETKVPILGTYQNVSTGADIVTYIQQHLNATTIGYAERIGQDLISNGFLRLIGNVGSVFANSSRMYYQWKPKVFQLTGYPEKRFPGQTYNRGSTIVDLDSPLVNTVGDYLNNWNLLNNAHPNETPSQKLRREAKESDERYKSGVKKQDLLRCTLEEAMVEHLRFMERCELDRLKAIKAVILDFSGAISNVIPSLQSTVDKMMLFQETVQPLGDLRYLLENYRTGAFIPRAPIYENYYNSVEGMSLYERANLDQTFGIDIEARARADRRRVPLVISSILTHLDHQGDVNRRQIWLVDVPLAATHRLRNDINNGKAIPAELLENYEIPIIASALKLYLLELPDSIVSSGLYEIIKAIYISSGASGTETDQSSTRISVLQNTLSQLRLANIATLDAITTHFVRLIDLTSADEQYVAALATSLAPCILRPKTETALSLEEKYSYRFLRDLLQYKDAIFNELKRAASISNQARAPSLAGDGTSKSPPSDESNRKANMEARARAIASRSRASSPHARDNDSPHAPRLDVQRQRRDSSRGPADTRFPVHATGSSPRTAVGHAASGSITSLTMRQKLDVPGSTDSSPVVDRLGGNRVASNGTNGDAANGLARTLGHDKTGGEGSRPGTGDGERRGSLGRAAAPAGLASPIRPYARVAKPLGNSLVTTGLARPPHGGITSALAESPAAMSAAPREYPLGYRPVSRPNSQTEPAAGERRGVELVDAPMDD